MTPIRREAVHVLERGLRVLGVEVRAEPTRAALGGNDLVGRVEISGDVDHDGHDAVHGAVRRAAEERDVLLVGVGLDVLAAWLKTGFKTVLVTPKGGLERSAWNEACSVLRARKLPSGDEVERLWIVVPLREHAIAVHERVVEAGFEAALYPGEDGEVWDPVPKGPSLLESTDHGAQADVGPAP